MHVYIVMGVSGVGKTTIGKLLAERFCVPFFDADDFHPLRNVEKMKKGIPLEDEDRKIWLQTLSEKIQEWNMKRGAVLACSALKEKYREQLQSIPKNDISWIFLHSEYEIILERLSSRKNHYFKPELLESQYTTLQIPQYGIHVNVNTSIENIVKQIMQKLDKESRKSKIGLMGLGVMGKSLAVNLASKGVTVSVYNRHVENLEVDIARKFAEKHRENYHFSGFDDLKLFVESLESPRNILLMVNAGKAVDLVIESLLPMLQKNDLIIDGGNSHYKDTARREKFLKEKGILFMGTGVSGGEEGALKGPSIMPGGSSEAYERVGDFLERIAAKDKQGNPCCAYVGPDGAGHFVKMVHNGIEYGEMQLIAEVYHFLRFHAQSTPEEIATLFELWNAEMQSYLLEISIDILRTKENGESLIDKILDAAKQKGTGGWSTNAALELGVPLDTITAAVMARNISGKKEERIAAEEHYNSLASKNDISEAFSEELFEAYKAASIINHAIGFDLIKEAGKEYDWNLNLSEIARIWTNGCIIRSAFMEDLVELLKESSEGNVLMHPKISEVLEEDWKPLSGTVGRALENGYPVPVLSSAANYFLSFTSGQSSANMIQAQRDYFGAHTYERTDKPRGKFFHTQWKPIKE
ncbi:NADP-dependent phosphogluconate dehydrogenase [Salinimicrobium sp. GXAS 041]|uniref:NADP-dependent phosphogluconate dehydrogenase n=1 Tax=Salinimicrobium sp. GXAS 041 TaxID=3400806 RepID=UPI003C74A8B7